MEMEGRGSIWRLECRMGQRVIAVVECAQEKVLS